MDKWLETWYGWPVWPSSSAYIFHMILEFWWEHISVMCSHHHLVCVCVLHINCVYVFTFPYYHYIFVVFTYQSPSNSAHLLWSISFLSSTIAHLIHFADHSTPPYLLYLVILIWHCHSVFHITLSRGFMKGLRQETVPSCEGRIQKEYPAMKKQSPAIRYLRKSQSIFEIFSITLKYLK